MAPNSICFALKKGGRALGPKGFVKCGKRFRVSGGISKVEVQGWRSKRGSPRVAVQGWQSKGGGPRAEAQGRRPKGGSPSVAVQGWKLKGDAALSLGR